MPRRARPRGARRAAPARGRRVAVADVRREHGRGFRPGVLRDPPAGAPAVVRLPPPAPGHRPVRRAHDVLDHAGRGPADARRARGRACRDVRGGERRRRVRGGRAGDEHGPPGPVGAMTVAVIAGIGLLGGVGAVARFLLDGAVSERAGAGFPYGTLAVNVSGSFVLGFVVGPALGGDAYRLVATGAIGAFTTFSTWMFETHRLAEDGELGAAVVNVAASLVLGIAAAWLGRRLGMQL